MKKTYTQTTANGTVVEISVALNTSKNVNADGHSVDVATCDLTVKATINGAVAGYGEPIEVNHPVAVARIGELLLGTDTFDKVTAMIDECKATPAYRAKIAAEKKATTEMDECDAGYDRIRRAMSL